MYYIRRHGDENGLLIVQLALRSYQTTRGLLVLRPQRADDDTFVYDLFRADCVARLGLGGMPDPVIDQLVGFQHKSQTESYRAVFPDASWSIVVHDGEDIGRLVENDDGHVAYVVDIVLRADRQGRGLATALLEALMQEWQARGRGARAEVVVSNAPSLKLWRKLGFDERPLDGARIEFRWRGAAD